MHYRRHTLSLSLSLSLVSVHLYGAILIDEDDTVDAIVVAMFVCLTPG